MIDERKIADQVGLKFGENQMFCGEYVYRSLGMTHGLSQLDLRIIIREVLEEAARVVESVKTPDHYRPQDGFFYAYAKEDCAAAIRGMKPGGLK